MRITRLSQECIFCILEISRGYRDPAFIEKDILLLGELIKLKSITGTFTNDGRVLNKMKFNSRNFSRICYVSIFKTCSLYTTFCLSLFDSSARFRKTAFGYQ